jgi:hypothetical protein
VAIAFVAERQQLAEVTGGGSHVFTPTGTLAAGNLAVACFAIAGAKTSSGASDTAGGNTWAVVKTQANGTSVTVFIAYSVLATQITTSNTVTLSTSGTDAGAGVLWEFSGVASGAAADQSAGSTGATTAMSSGATATLSQADELVIGAFGITANSKTFTAGSGYSQPSAGEIVTSAGSFVRQLAAEYEIVSSTAAVTADGTMSGTGVAWAGAAVTFLADLTPAAQFVRPDADLATTGWTTAPLWSKVNDQSDATFISGVAS